MGRKKKKPEYDSGELLNEVLNTVIEVYSKSFDREKAKGEIKAISDVLDITPIKVRKLLIKASARDREEYYSNDKSESIHRLHEEGRTVSEIMKETGLSRASVCGYLPYEKGIYNAKEVSVMADRIRLYRRGIMEQYTLFQMAMVIFLNQKQNERR